MVTTQAPVETEIIYPETDGMPMPDGMFQAPIYARIVVILKTHFRRRRRVHVNGDTFIYYSKGNPRRFVAPDCFVEFNLSDAALESMERNNTHLLWEIEQFPQFVMEIGSKSTAAYDQRDKRRLYARLGALEYWLYDKTGGEFYDEPLVGLRLVNGEYVRMEMNYEDDGSVWAHSDVLNLDLWWIDGELEIWDPAGNRWLMDLEEAEEARIAAETQVAEAQADRLIAEARADSETERADAAESLAARLEAELRRLRGEDE